MYKLANGDLASLLCFQFILSFEYLGARVLDHGIGLRGINYINFTNFEKSFIRGYDLFDVMSSHSVDYRRVSPTY